MKDKDSQYIPQLAKRIKGLRISNGITDLDKFAYESRIPRAQYMRYEKGTNITLRTLQRILKFHKITWKEFFSEGFE